MIFIGGVSPKIKPSGNAQGVCPACNRRVSFHACKKYSVVTLFFIPVIPFGASYLVTCSACASVLSLSKDKGRALETGKLHTIEYADLEILQNNAGRACPRCDGRVETGQKYCPTCGEKL